MICRKILSLFFRGISLFPFLLAIVIAADVPLNAAEQQVIYYHGNEGDKRIALTFDDGPHPRYTPEILGILDEYGIKATFFFIGQNIEYFPETAHMVFEAGHEIGNHTYSHSSMWSSTPEMMAEEIGKNDKLLKGLGCEEITLFRPPQGLYKSDLPTLLRETNKKAVLWNIDTRDWAHRPSMDIIHDVENNLRGGDIILFHDYVSGENTTIPAIKKLIPALIERGYQFVTVSQLLSHEKTPASR